MITRIRELLEARQLSPTQFADLIGVGRPVISHILSERNKPSLEVVQKIISAFPDISMPWLIAGTGSMLADAVAPRSVSSAPSVAEAAPAPIPAVPAFATPAPASPTAPSVASARPAAVPQPSSYPQPPRFRPAAIASAAPESPRVALVNQSQTSNDGLAAATVSTAAAPSAAALPATTTDVASSLPSSNPLPAPVVASSIANPDLVTLAQAPASPATPADPVAATSLGELTTPVAEVPATLATSDAPMPSSNPAAALSFLGEPGKAIRRIVIFYRDGSFSDYLPEGS